MKALKVGAFRVPLHTYNKSIVLFFWQIIESEGIICSYDTRRQAPLTLAKSSTHRLNATKL
ncbi:hypothetical protein A6S26_05440 [Nostoc sp. ATCC 43529]|nr:hypothetical protein A6S26_05440 [Nostoc sp. ATCC 43529]